MLTPEREMKTKRIEYNRVFAAAAAAAAAFAASKLVSAFAEITEATNFVSAFRLALTLTLNMYVLE